MGQKFNPKDAVNAKLGSCYVTIDGTRKLWLQVKEVKGTANISDADVPMLGTLEKGSKITGIGYSGSMTIYDVDSAVNDMVQKIGSTAVVPYFDLQVSNEDQTSSSGRRVGIFTDCHISGDIDLMKLGGDDFLMQEVNFKAAGFTPISKFSNTNSVIAG
ncbi:MAG: phage tail tube protein [Candidatus Omnitrophica bacterium]|nr:phage tail tube protein [Candidatus Omnitrophota bacterium]